MGRGTGGAGGGNKAELGRVLCAEYEDYVWVSGLFEILMIVWRGANSDTDLAPFFEYSSGCSVKKNTLCFRRQAQKPTLHSYMLDEDAGSNDINNRRINE